MKTFPRWLSTVSAAVLLAGMATAWIIFAPQQFGGQVAYVIVTGNSMEPLYQRGDLVIVHRATEYQIGDIVTYRHPYIGPVIHRIIGQQGDRFVLKGDHNTWTDSYLPAQADIIGKAWLYLAGVGQIIGFLRNPWILSILVACAGAVLLFTFIPSPNGTRPRRSRSARKGQQFPMKTFLEKRDDWLLILTTIALVALLLAGVAFARPLTRSVLKDIHYEQKGVFSYSAAVPDSINIYDSTGLQTGEPVFRRLINNVDIRFDYQVVSDNPIEAQGTVRLLAQLSSMDGWQRTFELQPATPFTGSTASVSGVVELKIIQAVLDNLQTQTGIQRQYYTLFIKPEVTLEGTVGGQAVTEYFAPQLEFQLDPFEMQLVRPDPMGPDPLYPSTAGLLKWPSSEPNTLSLLSLQLQVLAARWISIVVLVLALGGLTLLGVLAYRSAKTDGEPAHIKLKYGPLLVSVRDRHPGRTERVVEVETIDDLAKLANKDSRPILHVVKGQKHLYFVQDTGLVYRYVIAEPDKEKVL
jgi:signal peptidase I